MIELKATLDGTQNEIKENHFYFVDFSKLNSVNDLILILASMGIGFPSNHFNIEKLKPFLNLNSPVELDENGLPKLNKDGK